MNPAMKGVVFTELLDWIERRHGVLVLDEVLLDAELGHGGAYTSAGSYDWREFAAIVRVAAARTDTAVPELLRAFGRDLFGVFARRFPGLLGAAPTAFDVLLGVEECIHREVRKLHPENELPLFHAERTPTGLVLEYSSSRPFADLALGLLEGCLAHFDTEADVQVSGDERRRRFCITQKEEGACRATR